MDELGAEFDCQRRGGIVGGKDASTDAVAGFDAEDAASGGGEFLRGGEPGGSGADDEDIVGHVGHGYLYRRRCDMMSA